MLRALTLPSLLLTSWLPPVLLLLPLALSGPGEGRPGPARRGGGAAPDLVLEAVKTGILTSLGMEAPPPPPRPAEKATERELRTMYRLYRDTLRELRGNSSGRPRGESRRSPRRISTVLFPATVEPVKVPSSEPGRPTADHHIRWYRAVFHDDNPNVRSALTPVRAELKIRRRLLDRPGRPEQTEPRREVHVKVYVANAPNCTARRTHAETLFRTNVSEGVDISGWVERWRRLGGAGRSLVVEVGLVVGEEEEEEEEGGDPDADPRVAVEVDLAEPARRRRHRRSSDREDVCDAQGRCCRKALSVSFQEIGWSDWVVAPAAYVMRFCDGGCPHNYKPASMHAQVKSRMHRLSGGATPRPCCVPAAYEPMVIMHYDGGGKLKLTPFNDLIVSKCLCA